MRIHAAFCMGAALGLAATVSRAAEERIRFDAFAATVNTRVITIGDVRSAMEPAIQRLRLEVDEVDLERRADALFIETLERLIERELLAEEFSRREFTLPDGMVEAEISRLVSDRFGGRFSAFLDAMASERLTLDRYRARLRDEIKAMLLYQEEVTRRLSIRPSDVKAEYEREPSAFTSPERIRLRAIEFRGGEPEERRVRASEASARLGAGDPFADVARALSDERRAAEGGDWGWRNVSDLHPDIVTSLAHLAPGDISDSIEITDRLFVLKVEDREAERIRPLREVLSDIEARVRRREEERLREDMLQRLRRTHAVRILLSGNAG